MWYGRARTAGYVRTYVECEFADRWQTLGNQHTYVEMKGDDDDDADSTYVVEIEKLASRMLEHP